MNYPKNVKNIILSYQVHQLKKDKIKFESIYPFTSDNLNEFNIGTTYEYATRRAICSIMELKMRYLCLVPTMI